MNVLAIDCSTEILSLALKAESKIYNLDRKEGLRHSENLMPAIDWLFKQSALPKNELDLVSVAIGPGSFTGLRIALSTAKAIARGCDASLVGIPTLDLYGARYSFFPGLVVPVIDARKQCFYTAIYKKGKRVSDYQDCTEEKLKSLISPDNAVLFTGPHNVMIEDHVSEIGLLDPFPREGTGSILLQLGIERFNNQGADSMNLGPMYLRKSEAEIAAGM